MPHSNYGFYGGVKRQRRCSVRQIENYRQKISGPLLDRIDIHVEVPLVDFKELTNAHLTGKSSETIRERVTAACAHDRILKVARTLADLAGKPDITSNEVLEAIQYRSLDRQLFE